MQLATQGSFRVADSTVNGKRPFFVRHRIVISWILVILWIAFGGLVLNRLEAETERQQWTAYCCREMETLWGVSDEGRKAFNAAMRASGVCVHRLSHEADLNNTSRTQYNTGVCTVPNCSHADLGRRAGDNLFAVSMSQCRDWLFGL